MNGFGWISQRCPLPLREEYSGEIFPFLLERIALSRFAPLGTAADGRQTALSQEDVWCSQCDGRFHRGSQERSTAFHPHGQQVKERRKEVSLDQSNRQKNREYLVISRERKDTFDLGQPPSRWVIPQQAEAMRRLIHEIAIEKETPTWKWLEELSPSAKFYSANGKSVICWQRVILMGKEDEISMIMCRLLVERGQHHHGLYWEINKKFLEAMNRAAEVDERGNRRVWGYDFPRRSHMKPSFWQTVRYCTVSDHPMDVVVTISMVI